MESFVVACGRRRADVQHSSIIAPHDGPHVNIQILVIGGSEEFSWAGWRRGWAIFLMLTLLLTDAESELINWRL